VTETFVVLYCVTQIHVFARDDSLTMTYSINYPGKVTPRPVVVELTYQLYLFASLNSLLVMAEILIVPANAQTGESSWQIFNPNLAQNTDYWVFLSSE